jgi:hypothetical protein
LAFPPEFVIWSGVREKDFSARPEDLLTPESKPAEVPLDFMLQIAFTSYPAFGPRDAGRSSDGDGQEQVYNDSKPWEFPALKDHIQERVLAAVAKEGRAREILADCAEFATLQRLFRAAFAGQLGTGFPVERLAALEEQLAPARPPALVRTPRWNSRAGQAEFGALAAFGAIAAELAGDAGTGGANTEGFTSARDRIKARITLLEEFEKRFDRHVKAASAVGQPVEARDRLWSDWKQWRVGWLARYKALGAVDARAPQSGPAAAALSRAAQVDRYLITNAELRDALNVLRDDRQSLEGQRDKLPPLDP